MYFYRKGLILRLEILLHCQFFMEVLALSFLHRWSLTTCLEGFCSETCMEDVPDRMAQSKLKKVLVFLQYYLMLIAHILSFVLLYSCRKQLFLMSLLRYCLVMILSFVSILVFSSQLDVLTLLIRRRLWQI